MKVGRPAFPSNSQMTGPANVVAGQYKTYTVPSADGTTSYNWSFDYGTNDTPPYNTRWNIINGQGSTSIFVKIGSYANNVVVRCYAINSCGSTLKYKYVNVNTGNGGGGGDPDPCDNENMVFSSNPFSSSINSNNTINLVIDPDPCDDNPIPMRASGEEKEINIYNDYGIKVYSKRKKGKIFKIKALRRGLYIVQYQTKKRKTINQKINV